MRRWGTAVGAVAGAWLLSWVAYALGVTAVLPIVIVVGLVAIQRGRTPLDRVVIALAQLVGAVCAAGLLMSVWPWGLHPVPVAGFALTGLALIAVATGRRPTRLSSDGHPSEGHPSRRSPNTGDRLVIAGWLGGTAVALVPFVVRDLGGRIGLLATGEDLARHFVLYDAINAVGGYAFLHLDETARYTPDSYGTGVQTYPQGTHLLYAVLNRFWRAADGAGDGIAAMDFLIWCMVGTFSFLLLAVLWAVRRIAGPGARPVALAGVLAVAAAIVLFGDPITVLVRGYPNELLALTLLPILVAVLARPLHSTGEQVVTVGALLVSVSFAYYLFLPFAAAVAGLWALWRRRLLIARPWPVGTVIAATVPLMLVTPLLNPHANGGSLLVSRGTAIPVDRPLTVVLVGAAAFGAWYGRRAPSRRVVLGGLGVVVAFVAGLGLYQELTVGEFSYYGVKATHMLQVVALASLGTLARFVPGGSLRRAAVPALTASLVVVGAVVAAVAALGGPNHTRPGSYGLRVVLGVEDGSPQGGRDALLMARQAGGPAGPITVDLMHTPYANYFGTGFGAALRRDFRAGEPWWVLLDPDEGRRTPADYAAAIEAGGKPVRFFVTATSVAADLELVEALAARYPDRVEIVRR